VKALIGENIRIANVGEFPFVVSIITLSNITNEPARLHRCTASLISRQDVITSEHCLRALDATGYKILMGSCNLIRARSYFPLFWVSYNFWARHSDIRRQYLSNDIAITKVN
jgi:secreted trypsin-like serine protease